jgi:hypothetical protein
MIGFWCDETTPIKLTNFGRRRISIFKYGFYFLTAFIKKLLDGNIYNDFEFNEAINLLSCTYWSYLSYLDSFNLYKFLKF